MVVLQGYNLLGTTQFADGVEQQGVLLDVEGQRIRPSRQGCQLGQLLVVAAKGVNLIVVVEGLAVVVVGRVGHPQRVVGIALQAVVHAEVAGVCEGDVTVHVVEGRGIVVAVVQGEFGQLKQRLALEEARRIGALPRIVEALSRLGIFLII